MTHPSRRAIHTPPDLGARASDGVANFFGSWLAVFLHAVWFVVWLVLRLDINLLTLIVSLEAIYGFIFVLMTQNRAGQRDRLRDDTEASEVELLTRINNEQVEILRRLDHLPTVPPA